MYSASKLCLGLLCRTGVSVIDYMYVLLSHVGCFLLSSLNFLDSVWGIFMEFMLIL